MTSKAPPKAKSSEKPQPRARKKAPAAPRKPAQAPPVADGKRAAQAQSGGWGKAAAVGAAGAGIAALVYALSGKRAPARRGDDWPAHQVDGRNSSDQFAAQIADENMIPERVPAAIE